VENNNKIKKYKVGDKYHSLTIINEDAGRTKHGDRLVECSCVCGKKTITRGSYLGNGHSKSCGCLEGTKTKKHGMYSSKEYKAWQGIIQRCENQKHKFFPECGGKGIAICEEWRFSFESFLSAIGYAPDDESIICRKDVNKNFEPGNVYWGSGFSRVLSRKKWNGTSSRYKGVYWVKDRMKWKSEIKVGEKKIFLGYFEIEKEAYDAFCNAHLQYRGVAVLHGEKTQER
jgi:hypothetical protein